MGRSKTTAVPTAAAVVLPVSFSPLGLSLLSSAAVLVSPRAGFFGARRLVRSVGDRAVADPLAVGEPDRLAVDPAAVCAPDRLAVEPPAVGEPDPPAVDPAAAGGPFPLAVAVDPLAAGEPSLPAVAVEPLAGRELYSVVAAELSLVREPCPPAAVDESDPPAAEPKAAGRSVPAEASGLARLPLGRCRACSPCSMAAHLPAAPNYQQLAEHPGGSRSVGL